MKTASVGRIEYIKGYKNQLTDSAFYASGIAIPKRVVHEWFVIEKNGDIFIKAGYAWNGASGPTIDTQKTYRLSLFHDVWYQATRLGLLPQSFRKRGDTMLYRIGVEDGMWKIRVWYWFQGVRFAGDGSAQASAEPKPIYCPSADTAVSRRALPEELAA